MFKHKHIQNERLCFSHFCCRFWYSSRPSCFPSPIVLLCLDSFLFCAPFRAFFFGCCLFPPFLSVSCLYAWILPASLYCKRLKHKKIVSIRFESQKFFSLASFFPCFVVALLQRAFACLSE